MTKLLSHSDRHLQLLGWTYVANILSWLLRAFSEAGIRRSADSEKILIEHGFFKVLPEVSFILSIRAG